ncbi:MAG TPA: hypothetical protein VFE78_18755 [Gemmataceae bacterium]|nr:hypothetical protein [Gemmataceae bacterium]
MSLRQVALVSEATGLSFSELSQVSAAIQKQVLRDFGPLWNVQASVDAFPRLEDVPAGYWPVLVQDDIGSDDAGIHKKDKDRQPYAQVLYADGWEFAAGHETLEMLADPSGDTLVAGDSVMPGQGRVEYLQEVCDPCADAAFGYRVSGILLCDFYTPHYFDPVAVPGVRYDFTGSLSAPRQVLKGGYLSWHVPETDEWWQQVFFGEQSEFVLRSPLAPQDGQSLRAMIDRLPPKLLAKRRKAGRPRKTTAAGRKARGEAQRASAAKAASWRSQMTKKR